MKPGVARTATSGPVGRRPPPGGRRRAGLARSNLENSIMDKSEKIRRLRDIADEIRAIRKTLDDPVQYDINNTPWAFGALVREAIDLGAFSGPEHAALRANISGFKARTSVYGDEAHRSIGLDALLHAAHLHSQRGKPCDPVDSMARLYEIVADEIEELADMLDAGATTPLPSGNSGQKRPTANQMMLDKIQRDPDSRGWTVQQWAEYTKKGRATIAACPAWRELETIRLKLKAERAVDRRRKPKASDRRRD